MNVLIRAGSRINHPDSDVYRRAFQEVFSTVSPCCTLQLLCLGARLEGDVHNQALIQDILKRKKLFSKKEKRFLKQLAFVLIIKERAYAFKVFHVICSFVTYSELFMAPGFDLGKSVWNMKFIGAGYA